MKNKVCVITGANSGLGFESCKALAAMGTHLVMVCRSEAKGKMAQEQVRNETNNPNIDLVLIDLSSQQSIRNGAREIREKHPYIDILMNNAGAVISERKMTAEGIEMTFAINHLGPFLLTHTLLPSLQAARECRIVNLSSNNHFKAEMYWDDLFLSDDYNLLKAYGQSKLANVLFSYELHRQLHKNSIRNIGVHAVDPGANNTDIGTKRTNPFHALAWRIRRLWAMSPKEGAATQIHVATAPELKGVSGKFWRKSSSVESSRISYDEAQAHRLWQVSMDMCGLEDYFTDQQ